MNRQGGSNEPAPIRSARPRRAMFTPGEHLPVTPAHPSHYKVLTLESTNPSPAPVLVSWSYATHRTSCVTPHAPAGNRIDTKKTAAEPTELNDFKRGDLDCEPGNTREYLCKQKCVQLLLPRQRLHHQIDQLLRVLHRQRQPRHHPVIKWCIKQIQHQLRIHVHMELFPPSFPA
jgi:hypothetical protein